MNLIVKYKTAIVLAIIAILATYIDAWLSTNKSNAWWFMPTDLWLIVTVVGCSMVSMITLAYIHTYGEYK